MKKSGWVLALVAACVLGGSGTPAADEARPSTARAETARLMFQVSPTTTRGTLSEQVRQAVRALQRTNGRARIVRLRALVAGPGDLNDVAAIASEAFPAKARPVVSVVRIGGLAGGARVVIESVAESKTPTNPNGLAFVSGQLATAPRDPSQPNTQVAPLAEKSIANISAALGGLQLDAADVVRVTCFTSSLVDEARVRTLVAGAFAKAAVNVVQIQTAPANDEVECESVARLRAKPAEPVRLVNPTNAAFAQAAVVGAPVVLFTTTVAGASNDDAGVRAALTQVVNSLEVGGSAAGRVFYIDGYPTSPASLQKFRDIRWEFFDRAHAPASTNLLFEGVAGPEGGVGVDVIALPRE